MNRAEAMRHAEHMCDVYSTDRDDDHIGVISDLNLPTPLNGTPMALVSGHPMHGDKWFPIADLTTSCKVKD